MSMRLGISRTWLLRAVAAASAAVMMTAGAVAAGAPAPAPSAPAPPARNYGGPGDYALRERLVRLIGKDPDLRQEKFDLLLANGGAVFKGEMKTCALKTRLLRLASLSHGIINVTDDLRVRAADLPDETLRKAVLDLFEGRRE